MRINRVAGRPGPVAQGLIQSKTATRKYIFREPLGTESSAFIPLNLCIPRLFALTNDLSSVALCEGGSEWLL